MGSYVSTKSISALLAFACLVLSSGVACNRGFPSLEPGPTGLLTLSPATPGTVPSAPASNAPLLVPKPTSPPPLAGILPGGPNTLGAPSTPAAPSLAASSELERRARSLDETNQQLTTQLAQAQQQLQLYKDRSDLMQRQLADVSNQLRSNMATSRLAAMPPPPAAKPPQSSALNQGFGTDSTRKSGARLTANVSRRLDSEAIRDLGYDVEVASDGLRLRIPSDQLFQPGSAQLTPSGTNLLDRIADILRSNYSDRRIAIEGYTDNAPLYGGTFATNHQLTSAQTDAVLESWTRRSQLPPAQFVTLAHGSNHPIQDNQNPAGRAANRRIEIVIQAEGSL